MRNELYSLGLIKRLTEENEWEYFLKKNGLGGNMY
jgi:hypothetical protein